METLVKQKVKSKLQNIMEIIDEQKEEVRECNYLNKMNDIKDSIIHGYGGRVKRVPANTVSAAVLGGNQKKYKTRKNSRRRT
jgi:hypothetical protein